MQNFLALHIKAVDVNEFSKPKLLSEYILYQEERAFGHQPEIFRVTQLINCKNILFINLYRKFQKQFCVSF